MGHNHPSLHSLACLYSFRMLGQGAISSTCSRGSCPAREEWITISTAPHFSLPSSPSPCLPASSLLPPVWVGLQAFIWRSLSLPCSLPPLEIGTLGVPCSRGGVSAPLEVALALVSKLLYGDKWPIVKESPSH